MGAVVKCAGQEFESFTASRRFEDFLWSSVHGCPDLLSSTESSLPPLESKMPGDPISKPPLCQANNCEFLENLRHHRSGECTNPLGLPSTSVETLDQIREHDAGYWKSGRDCDLERVPFDLIRERRHQREADLVLYAAGRARWPVGALPVRGQPAGQVGSTQCLRGRGHEGGELPHLSTDSGSCINLTVEIALGDPREEILEVLSRFSSPG